MLDPIALAVIKGAFEQTADEMDLHLIHAAISPIISEMNDCANGIFHPTTGETIAQGHYGLPVFLANMQLTVQDIIKRVETHGGFHPGDVWILNDPYISGTHLPDVVMIAPHFFGETLVALFATTGHWLDIGGGQPGGWNPKATEIHQEGIFIPPIKLYDRGIPNEQIINLILSNLRLPNEVGGDLQAMVNVFSVGGKRMDTLIDSYGLELVQTCIDEVMDRAEAQMRSYIADFPDGVYEFEDFLDNDGITDSPVRFKIKISVSKTELEFDFSGTDVSPKGPLNLAASTTISMCYVVLKHLFPDVPVNGGAFRPTRFVIPKGCALDARYPHAVGGYLEMVGLVVDLILGALVQAIPERVPAAFYGTTGVMTMGGVHPETQRYFVAGWPYPGGYGGSFETDGLVHAVSPQSMATLMSFELSEHRYPILFNGVWLREGSGGAGWHSGGCGSTISVKALSDVTISVLGDRVDHRPFGVLGGKHGAPNLVEFKTDGKIWRPPMRSKYEGLTLHKDDEATVNSPGGGGYGDPLTRDLDMVERDLNYGYITRKQAETDYGVVISNVDQYGAWHNKYQLDVDASLSRREKLRAQSKA